MFDFRKQEKFCFAAADRNGWQVNCYFVNSSFTADVFVLKRPIPVWSPCLDDFISEFWPDLPQAMIELAKPNSRIVSSDFFVWFSYLYFIWGQASPVSNWKYFSTFGWAAHYVIPAKASISKQMERTARDVTYCNSQT